MIPVQMVEQLSTALARWDGRGPTEDDMLHAGKELASAAMAVLTWDMHEWGRNDRHDRRRGHRLDWR